MLTLLLVGATSTARAETAPAPRVDPAYLEYLAALEELDELGYAPPMATLAQLWPGQVGLFTPLGQVAMGSVTGGFPNLVERWYVGVLPLPDGDFELRHQGAWPLGLQYDHIADWNEDWQSSPCWVMKAAYKGLPDPDYTLNLVYEDDIDRYTFDLVQGGKIVGRLLREYHHVEGAEERFVDHWAFALGYDAPDEDGEKVVVRLAEYQYPTTTDYFADILVAPGHWMGFAQIQYKTIASGWICLGGLQL